METETAAEETTQPTRGSRHRGESAGGGTIMLGPKDQLIGRVVFEGDLRVQGTFEGEAKISGDVLVEGNATAKAKVEARNLSVRGSFEGEAAVKDRLLISGSGTVNGNVRVGRLVIEDGAVLNGSITMERPSGHSPNGHAAEG